KIDENNKHLTPTTQNYTFHNETTLHLQTSEDTDDSLSEAVSEKPKKFRRKTRVYALSGLLILILSAGIWQLAVKYDFYNSFKPASDPASKTFQNPSIIIFPFKYGDLAQENLGVGLADALSRKLGNIKRLNVISASTGRLLENEDLEKITNELGTVFIVRGTLDKNADNLIISAEMVNSSDGRVVWSESFSDKRGDFFSLQTLVAERVWTSLGIEPLPMEKEQIYRAYTNNQLAYELFLVGRYKMTNRSTENLRKAVSAFTQALDEDENFALAYIGLADAYLLLNLYDVTPPPDGYAKAEQAARKALEIDDNLASAHTSLGYIKFFKKRDRTGAELEFRRAIQINPSYAQAHHWFSLALSALKRPAEAISEAQTAERLDPRSSAVKSALCSTYFYARQYEQGLPACERAIALNEDFVPAHKTKRWIYQAMGNYEAALATYRREYSYSGGNNEPGWAIIKSQVEALGENREKALSDLKLAIETPEVKNNPFAFAVEIALAFNALGDKESALFWLEKSEAADNHGFNFMAADPRLENLQNEPRFQALVKKMLVAKN
ncbi:MAG TPA: hypothetical protein VGD05_03705, partial [Pyrinomonadaceae bacterium]